MVQVPVEVLDKETHEVQENAKDEGSNELIAPEILCQRAIFNCLEKLSLSNY